MRRRTLAWGILFVFTLVMFVFAPSTLRAQAELSPGMTQGEFALWLVNAIGAQSTLAKTAPAAVGQDAIDFLAQKLGIVPEAGWQVDEPISNELLANLIGDPDAAVLNFEELVQKVREYVQDIFDDSRLGIFRVLGATPSLPAV